MNGPFLSHANLRQSRTFRTIWNYLVLLGISWYVLTVPVYIALGLDSSGWSLALDIFWTLFFIADIFINFRLPIYKNGKRITNRRKIARHYIRGWFAVDLIATIPFDLILVLLFGSQPGMLQIVRLVRIFKVFRLFRLNTVVVRLSAGGKQGLVTDVVLDTNNHIKIALMLFWIVVGLNTISCGWLMIHPDRLTGDIATDIIY
ncbi:MAG: ion transporter, partial [Magnetococcales bacterium]|nr:ion transporter [Magnetococcales bacterium]